jgi:hypothetical protein
MLGWRGGKNSRSLQNRADIGATLKGVFVMKLSPKAVKQTLNQFEAQALPDNHPAVPQLTQLFGEHTYFLDDAGLHIVEPTQATDEGKKLGVVVKLASWSDADCTSLTRHPPESSDVVVVLEAA